MKSRIINTKVKSRKIEKKKPEYFKKIDKINKFKSEINNSTVLYNYQKNYILFHKNKRKINSNYGLINCSENSLKKKQLILRKIIFNKNILNMINTHTLDIDKLNDAYTILENLRNEKKHLNIIKKSERNDKIITIQKNTWNNFIFNVTLMLNKKLNTSEKKIFEMILSQIKINDIIPNIDLNNNYSLKYKYYVPFQYLWTYIQNRNIYFTLNKNDTIEDKLIKIYNKVPDILYNYF